MLSRSRPIADASIRSLHPEVIEAPARIRQLLERARLEASPVRRGLNARTEREVAKIAEVGCETMILQTENFDRPRSGQLFLSFECDGRPYFFSSLSVGPIREGRLVVRIPTALYMSERRDRSRRAPDPEGGDPVRVRVETDLGYVDGEVCDLSPDGLSVSIPEKLRVQQWAAVNVRLLDGSEGGRQMRMQLRSSVTDPSRAGWRRLGMIRSEAGSASQMPVIWHHTMDTLEEGEAGGQADPDGPRAQVRAAEVLRIENEAGEQLVGLIDGHGEAAGAPLVIVPNGWGQTKEAHLPLARTIVDSFAASGEAVRVLRFDGIRKRGESHNDAECRIPGREHDHFVFSQGVRDLRAWIAHFDAHPTRRPSCVILVSFSAAAVEARRVVAEDGGRRIRGWICLAGCPDIQSMARSISGGIDYTVGVERGVRFGIQELLGVSIDVERVGADGRREGLQFVEHARRDMASIRVPISWYHARFDGWVDLSRVRDIMSHGSAEGRKLVVMPTGHQLGTSREAAVVFRCVAAEVGRMALGRRIATCTANASSVRKLRRAELRRVERQKEDLRAFWRDYLVGRERSLGIDMLTLTSAYRAMMDEQVEGLELVRGQRILDLGSGTGSLFGQLAIRDALPEHLSVCSLDFVGEALARGRARLGELGLDGRIRAWPLQADLNLVADQQGLPMKSRSFDSALASLVISYLETPAHLLSEVRRVLRPGGRFVLSSMRRDADISRLYREAISELQVLAHQLTGQAPQGETQFAAELQNFLNDAARILQLEQSGAFRFYDPDELAELVRAAGFETERSGLTLGDPAQASLVIARKPLS